MFDRIVRIQRTKYYMPETLIGLGIVVVFNLFLLPDRPAFDGIDPNPLWIIPLAMAARYGRDGALFGGITTSIVFLLYYVLTGGTDVILDDLWLLRFPFFFILVSFMLGEVRTVFILREDYLTNRVEELQNQSEKLEKENEIIKEAHKDLTTDIATRQDTITVLNEITARLKSKREDDVYQGILDSFRDNLEAEECSFYAMRGDRLELVRSLGWKDYYKRPEHIDIGAGLVGLAAEKGYSFTIKDIVLKKHKGKETKSTMLGDSLLTVPVLGLEKKVFGVASIEKIDLLKLTESTIQTARVICDLAAASLNNIYAFKSLEDQRIREGEYDLYKYHYFLTRLNEEFLRSLNYMIPLSTIAFKFSRLPTMEEEKQRPMMESLLTLIRSRLRAFDVLAKGPSDSTPLVLLLATTSGPQAEELKKKIADHMKEYKLDKFVVDGSVEDAISVVPFNPHTMSSADDMLKAMGT